MDISSNNAPIDNDHTTDSVSSKPSFWLPLRSNLWQLLCLRVPNSFVITNNELRPSSFQQLPEIQIIPIRFIRVDEQGRATSINHHQSIDTPQTETGKDWMIDENGKSTELAKLVQTVAGVILQKMIKRMDNPISMASNCCSIVVYPVREKIADSMRKRIALAYNESIEVVSLYAYSFGVFVRSESSVTNG